MDEWEKVLRVFKMYTGRMVMGREMQKFSDQKSFAWRTLGFIRQTKEKSHIMQVDVKQKLILCSWEKNTENMRGM